MHPPVPSREGIAATSRGGRCLTPPPPPAPQLRCAGLREVSGAALVQSNLRASCASRCAGIASPSTPTAATPATPRRVRDGVHRPADKSMERDIAGMQRRPLRNAKDKVSESTHLSHTPPRGARRKDFPPVPLKESNPVASGGRRLLAQESAHGAEPRNFGSARVVPPRGQTARSNAPPVPPTPYSRRAGRSTSPSRSASPGSRRSSNAVPGAPSKDQDKFGSPRGPGSGFGRLCNTPPVRSGASTPRMNGGSIASPAFVNVASDPSFRGRKAGGSAARPSVRSTPDFSDAVRRQLSDHAPAATPQARGGGTPIAGEVLQVPKHDCSSEPRSSLRSSCASTPWPDSQAADIQEWCCKEDMRQARLGLKDSTTSVSRLVSAATATCPSPLLASSCSSETPTFSDDCAVRLADLDRVTPTSSEDSAARVQAEELEDMKRKVRLLAAGLQILHRKLEASGVVSHDEIAFMTPPNLFTLDDLGWLTERLGVEPARALITGSFGIADGPRCTDATAANPSSSPCELPKPKVDAQEDIAQECKEGNPQSTKRDSFGWRGCTCAETCSCDIRCSEMLATCSVLGMSESSPCSEIVEAAHEHISSSLDITLADLALETSTAPDSVTGGDSEHCSPQSPQRAVYQSHVSIPRPPGVLPCIEHGPTPRLQLSVGNESPKQREDSTVGRDADEAAGLERHVLSAFPANSKCGVNPSTVVDAIPSILAPDQTPIMVSERYISKEAVVDSPHFCSEAAFSTEASDEAPLQMSAFYFSEKLVADASCASKKFGASVFLDTSFSNSLSFSPVLCNSSAQSGNPYAANAPSQSGCASGQPAQRSTKLSDLCTALLNFTDAAIAARKGFTAVSSQASRSGSLADSNGECAQSQPPQTEAGDAQCSTSRQCWKKDAAAKQYLPVEIEKVRVMAQRFTAEKTRKREIASKELIATAGSSCSLSSSPMPSRATSPGPLPSNSGVLHSEWAPLVCHQYCLWRTQQGAADCSSGCRAVSAHVAKENGWKVIHWSESHGYERVVVQAVVVWSAVLWTGGFVAGEDALMCSLKRSTDSCKQTTQFGYARGEVVASVFDFSGDAATLRAWSAPPLPDSGGSVSIQGTSSEQDVGEWQLEDLRLLVTATKREAASATPEAGRGLLVAALS